jgi:sec-independent protein translocase protein TatA
VTAAQRPGLDTSNLVCASNKGDIAMHLSPPADLFGEQGIIVLIVVALVLFGSTQIPKLARSLGSAQKEFKKGLDEGGSDDASDTKVVVQAIPPVVVNPPAPAPAPAPAPVESNSDGSPGPTA